MSATAGRSVLDTPQADRSQPRPWGRADGRILSVWVVLLVLTQRIGVPIGLTSIGVALPLSFVAIGVLAARRRLTVSRVRGELLLVVVVAVLTTTVAVSLRRGDLSMPSLLLFLAVYLPWALRVAGPDGSAVVRGAGRTFVRVMVVLAAVGVAQFAAQLAGVWTYEDYLGKWVPPQFLVPNYNTSIPLVFGSDVYKSQAFLMLEPSLLSQFCALAVVVALMLRARPWQLLLLVAGMASAVSGTGILLLAAGSVLLLVRAPRQLRPSVVVVGVAAVVAVLLSPVAPLLLDRSGEVTQPSSSGYARFVAPYQQVLAGLAEDPVRYVTGAGPGNAERLLASARAGGGADVLYSVVPKLTFEYGVLAGGLVVLFLLVGTLSRAPWRVVPGTVVVMVFFLSGALLQPQTTFLAWLFTGFGSDDGPGDGNAGPTPSGVDPASD